MTDGNLQLDENEVRIGALLRSMTADDLEFAAPPDSLWNDIEAAVFDDSPSDAMGEESGESSTNNVVDVTSRFRRGTAFFAAAAAAVVVIIGALVVSASGNDSPTIEVVGVQLNAAALPPRAGEDLELWLIGIDAAGELTISTLGTIESDTDGTYEVPDDFDSSAFDTVLVDISYEPRDGDATHSGASIVRGEIIGT